MPFKHDTFFFTKLKVLDSWPPSTHSLGQSPKKKVTFWMPSPTESLLPTTWQKVKRKIVTNSSPSDFPQILLSGQGQGSNCSTQCVLHTHLSKMHLVHALNQCFKVPLVGHPIQHYWNHWSRFIQLNFNIFAFLTYKIQTRFPSCVSPLIITDISIGRVSPDVIPPECRQVA